MSGLYSGVKGCAKYLLTVAVVAAVMALNVSGVPASAVAAEDPVTAAGKPAEGALQPFLGEPVFEKTMLFGGEGERTRGAHMVVTLQGTVLARGGGSMRRSEDGGMSWSEPESHPRPEIVDETTGEILALRVRTHHGELRRSTDDGRTWSPAERVEIKPNAEMRWIRQTGLMDPETDADEGRKTYRVYMCSGESGITLRHGEYNGRLLLPVGFNPESEDHASDREGIEVRYTAAIYSDDGGNSWQISDFFPEGYTCSESAIAELSDGRIYFNARSHMGYHHPSQARELTEDETLRREAWSYDGGRTWEDFRVSDILPDGGGYFRGYGLRGGLVRLPVAGRDVLIYSNADTSGGERVKMTVWASFDGGDTWPVKRLVYEGPCAYSTLRAGRPGTPSEGSIFLLFEGAETHRYHGIQFARFNLSWLLAGEETGHGEIPVPSPISNP